MIAKKLDELKKGEELKLAKVEYEPTRGQSSLLRIKATKRDFFSKDKTKLLVWRNLFYPTEILNAFDCRIRTLETYAALFGRRPNYVKQTLGKAAQKGFDQQTCSFLRMLEGMELEKPDFAVSTAQPCQQGERIFADLTRTYGIPDRFYSLQTPINGHSRSAVEMIADGLEESVAEMEKAFGRKLDPARLEEACVHSNEAAALVRKCAELRFTSPPLVRGSEAIYNAVVFSQLWGRQELVDIQKAYLEELLMKKEWAEKRYSIEDTHRLLWLHLPPFYDTKHLDYIEKTCNAPIVFEETNYAGWEPLDPKDPYRSLAKKLLQSGFLDPSLRVEYVKKAVAAGKFNGVILYTHGFGRCSLADRSLSKLLRENLDEIGEPLLALAAHLAGDFDADALLQLHPRGDLEKIVVLRRRLVVRLGMDDREHEALGFALLVGVAARAHQLVARPFEQRHVVAVVHDPHLIRVGVRDAVFGCNSFHKREGEDFRRKT